MELGEYGSYGLWRRYSELVVERLIDLKTGGKGIGRRSVWVSSFESDGFSLAAF